jgi:CDP-glucose 4,6-dehydratase
MPDPDFWRERRVLVTGHTGFIGGWLCACLHALGAEITGFALAPLTHPSFYDLTGLANRTQSAIGDIRSASDLAKVFAQSRPQIVFHLAAQALVGEGYSDPAATFCVNLMGTVNLLEASRRADPETVVAMTSDKVYAPAAGEDSHREDDRLGPSDPYGASKACCEHAVEAYARSFFAPAGIGVASVRAGNVIGGGDWGADRLVPDAVRAFSAGTALALRRPGAVRPWQHVLDAVNGLLVVAEAAALRRGPIGAWNIGPPPGLRIDVAALAQMIAAEWGDGVRITLDAPFEYPETAHLAINSSRAQTELGLPAPWPIDRAVAATVTWYRTVLGSSDAWVLTQSQIAQYETDTRAAIAKVGV